MSGEPLRVSDAVTIAHLLLGNSTLQTITLSASVRSSRGTRSPCVPLRSVVSLPVQELKDGTQPLHLACDDLTDEGAVLVAHLIKGNAVVPTITLSSSPLPVQRLKGQRHASSEISLVGEDITSTDALVIGHLLQDNTTVQAVKLSHFSLPVQELTTGALDDVWTFSKKGLMHTDVVLIASLLHTNSASHLRALVLHGNRIGDVGAAAIAKGLESNGGLNLRVLDISGSMFHHGNIGNVGAAAIGRALASRGALKLEDLNLNRNTVGNKGATAIAKGLSSAKGSNLRRLSLSENSIGYVGVEAIDKALGTNMALELQWLDLRRNRFKIINPVLSVDDRTTGLQVPIRSVLSLN
mmetsp:Transcript_27619/g.74343  ORF Transcript_27619/g.74343 Transcript_27619/m.74343 type:complete len:353 (+) Transcript_27619:113-1171(+)